MSRRILIVLIGLVLFVGCTSKAAIQKKYENLYRAAKAIEGATAVGVNYQKFGELLQSLATELSIAKDKAKSDNEKELLKGFQEVLIAYQDSSTVWEGKIRSAGYNWILSGQILVEPELDSIVKKYSLPTKSHEFQGSGNKYETISEDAIPMIWTKAREQLEKATKTYYG